MKGSLLEKQQFMAASSSGANPEAYAEADR
jgi:hypothetical protein